MYKVIPKRACNGFGKISKKYFLSLLPSYPDTRFVLEVGTGAFVRIDNLDTIEKRADIRNGLYKKKYKPIERAYPKKLLEGLDESDWIIKSFNSTTKEICFTIKGDKNFSYIIPERFFS